MNVEKKSYSNLIYKKNAVRFILFECLFVLLFHAVVFSETIKIAEGFYYNRQYEKAIDSFMKTEEYKSEDPEVYYMIGLCYFMIQKPDNAVGYWTAAKKLKPGIFQGRIFRIPTNSMMPTLISGDHIIIDQNYYKYKKINRGDVVVFLYPENTKLVFVQRVIGLPGDQIEIRNKKVTINGIKFHDLRSINSDKHIFPAKYLPRDNFGPVKIPDNEYFLLGDNRDECKDSRFFGPVDKNLIFGRALVVYGSSNEYYSTDNVKSNRSGLIIE